MVIMTRPSFQMTAAFVRPVYALDMEAPVLLTRWAARVQDRDPVHY